MSSCKLPRQRPGGGIQLIVDTKQGAPGEHNIVSKPESWSREVTGVPELILKDLDSQGRGL